MLNQQKYIANFNLIEHQFHQNNMSIFAKGDFHIKDTWADQKEKSKDKGTPKGQPKNSILQNAAKNSFEPTHHILPDDIAKRVLNQFNMEGPIEGAYSQKNIQARTPSRGSDKGQRKVASKQPISSKNLGLPPKQKTGEKSDDLLTSMAARLSKMQQVCQAQRLELKQKNTQIDKLKQENDFMRKMKNSPEAGLKEIGALKDDNASLLKKVGQMQVFLKSYGLKWVGNKMQGKLNQQQLKKDMQKPKYNYHLPSQVDINTVARRIQELNMGLHQEGVSTNQVYKDQGGVHRFRASEPLLMGFYKDGISIQGYKFFPYKSKQSIQILGDILDGYFPYVLKSKYPNGTYLKIVDKIDHIYNSEDAGQIKSLQTAEDKLLKPMSKEQFLNKLPKSITKNGKVIQVRTAIEDKLNGKKESPPIIKQQDQNQYYQQDSQGVIVFKTPEVSEEELCTLKIRTQTGQVCLLKLSSVDKMKDVYKWMSYVSKSKDGFKVFSNYPKREYFQSESQTLEQLGLSPNSVLHLEMIKK